MFPDTSVALCHSRFDDTGHSGTLPLSVALACCHSQELRTALGCDREEAVALMRHAGGNSTVALRNAVQATHLDNAAVLQLAQDYATFRQGAGLSCSQPPLPAAS